MTKHTPVTGFSPGERDYIRRELDMFFSTLPTVAEGFQLKTWRGGPQAGMPKVPPVARSLVDRGLMRLDTSERLPRLFFTEAGLVELRAMVADRRLTDPKRFAMSARSLASTPWQRRIRRRSDGASISRILSAKRDQARRFSDGTAASLGRVCIGRCRHDWEVVRFRDRRHTANVASARFSTSEAIPGAPVSALTG
jgi:hypothetical protein